MTSSSFTGGVWLPASRPGSNRGTAWSLGRLVVVLVAAVVLAAACGSDAVVAGDPSRDRSSSPIDPAALTPPNTPTPPNTAPLDAAVPTPPTTAVDAPPGLARNAEGDDAKPGATPASKPSTTTASVSVVDGSLDVPAVAVGPKRLRVGTIDADVTPVGVAVDGWVDVPPRQLAGWYRFGADTRSLGAIVVVGHVDYDGVPGVFYELEELTVGMTVELTDTDEVMHSFRVDEKRSVAKEDLFDLDVLEEGGPQRLVMITCGGQFDRETRHYDDNVVVVASLLD